MIDASTDGSIVAMSRAILSTMADRQRGVHPHFFGVTMLNLAQSSPCFRMSRIWPLASRDEAIDALRGDVITHRTCRLH